jgi:hypothetical protein
MLLATVKVKGVLDNIGPAIQQHTRMGELTTMTRVNHRGTDQGATRGAVAPRALGAETG